MEVTDASLFGKGHWRILYLASCRLFFLDIARYACEKPYVNALNIKQKYNQILMTDLGLTHPLRLRPTPLQVCPCAVYSRLPYVPHPRQRADNCMERTKP